MKRLIASLAGACLLLASCVAHAGEKVMYQEITDNKPEVGVSVTVYLGDRMLEQRRGEWQECIVPKFSEEKKVAIGMAAIFIKAGQPLCKKSQNSTEGYWSTTYDSYVYYVNGGGGYKSPLKLKIKNKSIQPCISSACFTVRQPSDFENDPYFVYSENTFQQTIEYAGRSGDVLKFTYSEFTNGYARQAFTREFQVDLTQGKVAAYKGAIIEIESATNASITYKVVRNFQQ